MLQRVRMLAADHEVHFDLVARRLLRRIEDEGAMRRGIITQEEDTGIHRKCELQQRCLRSIDSRMGFMGRLV